MRSFFIGREGDGGQWEFYIRVDNEMVALVFTVHENKKYIKAVTDADEPRSLLLLPDGPAHVCI